MNTELHICPLCKCAHANIVHQLDSFGFKVKYYQCTGCGFIFQDAQESQASDTDFYTQTYRQVYQASESPTTKDLAIQKQRAEHTIKWLRQKGISKINNALDIGASAGVFLNAIKESYQCDVSGVEPGNMYRQYAIEYGIRMFSSLEEMKASNCAPFTLVSLMHVLEHFPEPLEMLKDVREQLITTDGFLLIEVPNFYAHDSYELAHLACYTRNSLRQMIKQAGYKLLAIRSHGFPRSKLLKLYLTVLATPSTQDNKSRLVRPDHCVSLKRKLSLIYRRVAQKLLPQLAWLPLKEDQV